GTKNRVSVNNLDRGTHQIKATIVARNGRTLISSDSVSFTLHRYSALQNNSNTGSGGNLPSLPNNSQAPTRPPPPPSTPPTAPVAP
ncbi:MAG: hypothetical protein ACR2PU_03350, partial [Gammaproteobacteria bacterium]